MSTKRPHGVLALGWASLESAITGRTEHRPTSQDYPDSLVHRIQFEAGGGLGWKISAITTPRDKPAPWKIVVITGAPSWAEYWAPVLAALPLDRELVVVDRPGFAGSEPHDCVPNIQQQALALSPLMTTVPGQRLILVGQSYGAAIATLMAGMRPKRLAGLVMLSSLLGELGPTARWLVDVGERVASLIPRDLRHAIMEVRGQPEQLAQVRGVLQRLTVPVHVIHGDQDDFAPVEMAQKLVAETNTLRPMRFALVPGANHFLNDGPAELVMEQLEACLPQPGTAWFKVPRLPKLEWPKRAPVKAAVGVAGGVSA
jgi:pimeloyl-ACP methyl ester carboxylesterase